MFVLSLTLAGLLAGCGNLATLLEAPLAGRPAPTRLPTAHATPVHVGGGAPLPAPVGAVSPAEDMPPAPTAEFRKNVMLAWFYKPPQDGDLAWLAGNMDFFVLTHKDEETRDALRQMGSQAPVLQYYLMQEIQDPDSCSDVPYGNQVAYNPGDFCRISEEHPDWFLINQNGERIAGKRSVMMDPGSEGFRDFWLQRALESRQQWGWEGVFIDNVEASLGKRHEKGQLPIKYPDNASYQAAIEGFLAHLSNGLRTPGHPLWANVIAVEDDLTWQRYLAYLDGVMIEDFAVDWTDGYRSQVEWETQMDRIGWVQEQGKSALLVAQGEKMDFDRFRFTLASYLLVNDGRAYFRYANDQAYDEIWAYEPYTVQLGRPLGPRYQKWRSWYRDFEHGSVWVSPGQHTAGIELK